MIKELNHDLIHYYRFNSLDDKYTYLVAYIRHGNNRTRQVNVKLIDNRDTLPQGCLKAVTFSYLCYKLSLQQLISKAQHYFNQDGITYEL